MVMYFILQNNKKKITHNVKKDHNIKKVPSNDRNVSVVTPTTR